MCMKNEEETPTQDLANLEATVSELSTEDLRSELVLAVDTILKVKEILEDGTSETVTALELIDDFLDGPGGLDEESDCTGSDCTGCEEEEVTPKCCGRCTK